MKKLVKNKKGAEMTIGTIIIIVLALVVLVVLIVGFTRGWTNLWDKVKAFFGGGDNVGTMIESCNLACASNLQYDYCLKERDVKFEDKTKNGKYNCKALEGVGGGLSCDKNFENCAEIKKQSCEDSGGKWVAVSASGGCTSGEPIETSKLTDNQDTKICCKPSQ